MNAAEIFARDDGHGGAELNAEDLAEGIGRGKKQGAALAGADVDEGVVLDGERGAGEPEIDEGVEDGRCDGVVGSDEADASAISGGAGAEVGAGDKAAGVSVVGGVEGMDGQGWRGERDRWSGLFGAGWHGLAELDEVAVAVQAEGAAAKRGDVDGGPGGLVEEVDLGAADGWNAGEAVEDLGAEVGFDGVVLLGGGEGYGDAVARGYAGDAAARGCWVFEDGEGAEEAEVDNVAGEGGVVAVAESGSDFYGFGSVVRIGVDFHCRSLHFAALRSR